MAKDLRHAASVRVLRRSGLSPLRASRTSEARKLLLSDWPDIRRSLFTRKSQIHKSILFFLRGRNALDESLSRPGDRELRVEIDM